MIMIPPYNSNINASIPLITLWDGALWRVWPHIVGMEAGGRIGSRFQPTGMSKQVPTLAGASDVLRDYTLAEVAQHCSIDDCWVIIHGSVYDVTKYLDKHPGGPNLVMKSAGSDATVAFEAMYHSSRARGILQELKIGQLDEKSKNSAGSLLNPYAAGAARPGMAKGSGPYGLGAYNPKQPLSRMGTGQTTPQRPSIDEIAWRRFDLLNIVPINHDTSLFRFQIPHKARLNAGMGKHLSVGVTINGKMTKRDYTPITDEAGYFELLVKHYDQGPISSYIHTLKSGDGALMRGLYGTLQVKPNTWSHLFMFAAGTGIAPMMPFIRYFANVAAKEAEMNKTANGASSSSPNPQLPRVASHLHLVFANKTEDDILLRKELEKHAAIGNGAFTIHYILSRSSAPSNLMESPKTADSPAMTPRDIQIGENELHQSPLSSITLHYGRISENTLERVSECAKSAFKEELVQEGPTSTTFSLICGPDGFVESVKTLITSEWHFSDSNYHTF